MTREEAVRLLQATRLMLMDGANQPISDLYYALDMAIEALEQTEPHIVGKHADAIIIDESNCSEKPNNSLDKDTNVRSKYDCKTCKHDLWHTPRMCGKCVRQEDGKPSMYEPKTEPLNQDLAKNEPTLVKDLVKAFGKYEPQTDPCDGCVCDDGKHLMYCMNCKGIAWKTEPPKVEDEPQTESSTNEEKVQLTDCAWGKGEE